jgi:hypothetical protein
VVFDHEEKRVFAGRLEGMREAVDAALARAPDRLVGGPYTKVKDLAAKIAKKRKKIGREIKALRAIAADNRADPEKRREAEALLARLTAHSDARIDKAETLLPDVVNAARIYEELALLFEGDEFGDRAAGLLDGLLSAPGFEKEFAAAAALEKANADFRKLPPAGNYAYDLTYTPVKSRSILEKRDRMLAAYRKALEGIIAKYPESFAAGEAQDVLAYDLD